MNTTTIEKKQSITSLESLARRILPESIIGQVLVWIFFLISLLIFSIEIAYLNISSITHYLPLIAMGSACACFFWRTRGITIVYLTLGAFALFFYKEIPVESRPWHMGMILAFAINSFIVLLLIEEIESLIGRLVEEMRMKRSEAEEKASALNQSEIGWQYEKEKFEQEIERLKDEAQQRQIEKSQIDRKLTLVQSEIEMLNQQKSELITDSFNARTLASERLGRLEEQIEEVNQLVLLLQKAENEKKQLESQLLERSEPKVIVDDSQLEILKNHIFGLENQLSEMQEHFSSTQMMENQEKAKLQEEILSLTRQIEENKSQVIPVDPEEVSALKRAQAHAEGLYKQLREQFDEKSKILSQTRSELFQTQGKLLSLEKELELQALDPDLSEFEACVALLKEQCRESIEMEEEIISLEEVIAMTSRSI